MIANTTLNARFTMPLIYWFLEGLRLLVLAEVVGILLGKSSADQRSGQVELKAQEYIVVLAQPLFATS